MILHKSNFVTQLNYTKFWSPSEKQQAIIDCQLHYSRNKMKIPETDY